MKIDSYRDGGTVCVEHNDAEVFVDKRIATSTPEHVYLVYPSKGEPVSSIDDLNKVIEILKMASKENSFYAVTLLKGLVWAKERLAEAMTPTETIEDIIQWLNKNAEGLEQDTLVSMMEGVHNQLIAKEYRDLAKRLTCAIEPK